MLDADGGCQEVVRKLQAFVALKSQADKAFDEFLQTYQAKYPKASQKRWLAMGGKTVLSQNLFLKEKRENSFVLPRRELSILLGFLTWDGMKTHMVSHNFAICDRTCATSTEFF